jgi:hypothetical protein
MPRPASRWRWVKSSCAVARVDAYKGCDIGRERVVSYETAYARKELKGSRATERRHAHRIGLNQRHVLRHAMQHGFEQPRERIVEHEVNVFIERVRMVIFLCSEVPHILTGLAEKVPRRCKLEQRVNSVSHLVPPPLKLC